VKDVLIDLSRMMTMMLADRRPQRLSHGHVAELVSAVKQHQLTSLRRTCGHRFHVAFSISAKRHDFMSQLFSAVGHGWSVVSFGCLTYLRTPQTLMIFRLPSEHFQRCPPFEFNENQEAECSLSLLNQIQM
jgi:hypothetical protein